MGLCLILGLGLRLWSAETTVRHADEMHYASDAGWSVRPLPDSWRLAFVREHALGHPSIDWNANQLVRAGDRPGARPGHPFLFPLVTGLVFAVAPPANLDAAVHTARLVNAVADASTIVLLPLLTGGLGAAPAAGVVAAACYAIFPPAAAYAGIALLEPMSAPLLVLALALVVRRRDRVGPVVGAGVATGLLLCTEIWSVTALPALGLLLLVDGKHRVRDLVAWLVASVATACAVTSPAAWMTSFGGDPFRTIRFDVHPTLRANLGYVADTQQWYFLGFGKHGYPMAYALARLHGFLTPVMLTAFVACAAVTIIRQRTRELLALYLPVLLLLAFAPPSDGIFRHHQAFPLVCAALGTALAALGARRAFVLLVPATAVGLLPVMPDRLNASGQVDLADLLVVNPGVQAPFSFYGSDNPLRIGVAPGMALTRRLFLPPGRYDVVVQAEGWPEVEIDGQVIVKGELASGPRKRGDSVYLDGWIHTLHLRSPVAQSRYGAVVVRPTPPEGPPRPTRAQLTPPTTVPTTSTLPVPPPAEPAGPSAQRAPAPG